MEDNSNRSNRRSVLKKLGLGATALTVPAGTVAGSPGNGDDSGNDGEGNNKRTNGEPVSAGIAVDPSTPGLDDRERQKFVENMRQKYGDAAADSIEPSGEASVEGQQPGISPGNLVWDSTQPLEVKNGIGDVLVESDNYAALYETDVYKDDGDKRYYFYWLWSSAQAIDQGYVEGNIKKFWNHINLQNYADVTTYDPGGDIKKNGIPVTVSASVSGQTAGGAGASAGIEGDFYLSQDVVGPKASKTSQSSDEFAVQWEGNYEGNQEINGTMVERRSTWDSRDFTWTVYLDGDGI